MSQSYVLLHQHAVIDTPNVINIANVLKERLTFFPTSLSRKKKPAPKSSSCTFSESIMMSLPIPARTIFLISSVATPRKLMTQMQAFRILKHVDVNIDLKEMDDPHLCCASSPHSRICRSYRAASS